MDEQEARRIKGIERSEKLRKKKAQMKVNSGGLKTQILPLLVKKYVLDPHCTNHRVWKCGNEPGCRCSCHDG